MERKVHLPVVAQGSLRTDGSRNYVHPADVRGRFDRARRVVFVALIALWVALPWVRVGGNPAVLLDVAHRRFFLFGMTFNSQDLWLLFFLLTGVGFLLVYLTAIAGRVFCGWACPQTVFLDGVYRRIERWFEGPRERRIRRNAAPWTAGKLLLKVGKHASFIVLSLLVAHIFLSYFVSVREVWAMVRGNPSAHPEAFAWVVGIAALFYGNFAWFREQLCVVVCPYGRLQSVLIDADSLVVGYDERRGEPRGKATESDKGDCVDCKRCVVVCPTGIDIRNGLQLDCIACTACIDACDEVMDKLERPRGLIRYDSLNGLQGKPRKWLRPRIYLYTALLALGAAVTLFALHSRADFEANVLRLPGPPYVLDQGVVRNSFEIHVVNKRPERRRFTIVPEPQPGLEFVVPLATVTLDPMGSVRAPLFVSTRSDAFRVDFPVRFHVRGETGQEKTLTTTFAGPAQ